jgi:electron transport complex protein RnfB
MQADAAAIDALLPQTQCRRCDYPDCRAYAEAIAKGEAAINQCPPGGEATLQAISALLGVESTPIDPARGGFGAAATVARIEEAHCIGCVKCIEVCPVDAIIGAPKLMHTVVSELCSGCELCIPVCPTDCIAMSARPPAQNPALLAPRWRRDHQRREARSAKPPAAAPLAVQAGEFDIAAALARAQAKP